MNAGAQALATAVAAAIDAGNRGRWEDAERSWRQVLALDARHPQAHCGLGMHAFRSGRMDEALAHLQAAHAAAPGDPSILLSIAMTMRERGDIAAEGRAIDAALAADPYSVPALLAKAGYHERQGLAGAAAEAYRNALRIAPPEQAWPPVLRKALAHGRELAERHGRELAAFLAERTGTRMAALTAAEAERWREAGAILSGLSEPYASRCTRLTVPRLPAIPFFERTSFEWAEALESRTAEITAELEGALAGMQEEFEPYVAYPPGTPLNQWADLNHSRRWSSYFIWRNARAIEAHQAQCPLTVRALREVEMAEIDGLCPNAMFSALAPHSHIPPHQGETNARVVVHLPLIVPPGCHYRVGFEHRQWEVGRILAFDDTIEHEARNDGDELRVVLIFDVWNPLLSTGERDMVRAITAARREFNAGKLAGAGG